MTSKADSIINLVIICILGGAALIYSLINKIKNNITKNESKEEENDPVIRQQKIIDNLVKILEEDKKSKNFNRQNYGEGFADNFARMYGYGAQLMSGLQKCSADFDKKSRSWFEKEMDREKYIYEITVKMITDVHKTELHRIKSLLDEYKADIDDPNTPVEVKRMLEDDMKELKLVLDKYLNNMSDFQNKINNTIADSIDILNDDTTPEAV